MKKIWEGNETELQKGMVEQSMRESTSPGKLRDLSYSNSQLT